MRHSASVQIIGTLEDYSEYGVSFKFTVKIDKLTIAGDGPELTPEDEEKS